MPSVVVTPSSIGAEVQAIVTLEKLSALAADMPPALQMAFSSSPSMLGYPGLRCMPYKQYSRVEQLCISRIKLQLGVSHRQDTTRYELT